MSKWSANPEIKARQKAKVKAKHKLRMLVDADYRSRCKAADKRRLKARKATDPTFRKQFNRRKALQANYGISLEDYGVLQVAQNNECGICGLKPQLEDKALAVDCDHDQEPPYVRGLLCMGCNTGIGKLKHDPRLLQRAIDWLNGVR